MSESKALIPQPVEDHKALAEPAELTVDGLIAQVAKVQQVMEAVMKQGLHYGVIPGCGDKPTLFKPGAEKLALVFRLCPSFDVQETDLEGGHKHYRIICTLTHITTGAKIAEGVGSASTMEAKYRWRNADRKCPTCGEPAIIKGKQEYGGGWVCFKKKGGCGAKWPDDAKEITGQSVGRVENPDLADTYNTVLKMAKKRAQIDATLTATGASDIFAQDLEDLAQAAAAVALPREDEPAAKKGRTRRPRTLGLGTQQKADEIIEAMKKAKTVAALGAEAQRAAGFEWADDLKAKMRRAFEACSEALDVAEGMDERQPGEDG